METGDHISTTNPSSYKSVEVDEQIFPKSPKFFTFTTSDRSRRNVNIILKNLAAFSNFASNHSLQLSVHCPDPETVAIRLIPSVPSKSYDIKRIFRKMKRLVKKKLKINNIAKLNNDCNQTAKELDFHKKLTDCLSKRKDDLELRIATNIELLTLKEDYIKMIQMNNELMHGNEFPCTCSKHEDPVEYNEQNFFKQTNLELIRNSRSVMYKIINKILKINENPFNDCISKRKMKRWLLKLFDILQTDLSTWKIDVNLIDFVVWCARNFATITNCPSEEELKKVRDNINEKYELENTVGSLVPLCFGECKWTVAAGFSTTELYCVIVNNRILAIKEKTPHLFEDIIKYFQEKACICSPGFRLATTLPVERKDMEYFVQSYDNKRLNDPAGGIPNNSSQFSAKDQSFQLSIECKDAKTVSFRLTTNGSTETCDKKKPSKKREKRERKLAQNQSSGSKHECPKTETKEMILKRKLLFLLDVQQNEIERARLMRKEMLAVRDELNKIKNELGICNDDFTETCPKHKKIVKFDEESFFNQFNMQLFRNHRSLIFKMIDKLLSSFTPKDFPFKKSVSKRRLRNNMMEIFDILQKNLDTEKKNDSLEDFMAWSDKSHDSRHTMEELMEIRDDMYKKHQLEDTIGTVHSMTVGEGREDAYVMYFVIVDKRIVSMHIDAPDVIEDFRLKYLAQTAPMYSLGFRLVTRMAISGDDAVFFVHCSDDDVYKENERVITWMKNNFKCLEFFTPRAVLNGIAVIYNVGIDLF